MKIKIQTTHEMLQTGHLIEHGADGQVEIYLALSKEDAKAILKGKTITITL